MALTPQQIDDIKKQLLSQVDKLPADQNKDQVKSYILGLNEAELEEFLKQNNIQIRDNGLLSQGGEGGPSQERPKEECVFCSIIKGQIPSYRIMDNKKAIAILEINPLSKGHSIILPLKHANIEEIPKSALTLSQKLVKKIKSKLKADDVKIETSSLMGHAMINIIPLYKDQPLKKIKAEEKDLKQLQNKLEVKQRKKRKSQDNNQDNKSKEGITNVTERSLPKIPFRIP